MRQQVALQMRRQLQAFPAHLVAGGFAVAVVITRPHRGGQQFGGNAVGRQRSELRVAFTRACNMQLFTWSCRGCTPLLHASCVCCCMRHRGFMRVCGAWLRGGCMAGCIIFRKCCVLHP